MRYRDIDSRHSSSLPPPPLDSVHRDAEMMLQEASASLAGTKKTDKGFLLVTEGLIGRPVYPSLAAEDEAGSS